MTKLQLNLFIFTCHLFTYLIDGQICIDLAVQLNLVITMVSFKKSSY